MKQIPFEKFAAKISKRKKFTSCTGKKYEIESIDDGIITTLNPGAVSNKRCRIPMDALYQAYLNIDVHDVKTATVRPYIKTGTNIASALLYDVFVSPEIKKTFGSILKDFVASISVEDRVGFIADMPYGLSLAKSNGDVYLPQAAYALGVNSDPKKCVGMSHKKLEDAITEKVLTQTDTWINDLPLLDLMVLKAVRDSDNFLRNDTPQAIMLEGLGLVSMFKDSSDNGVKYIHFAYTEVLNAVDGYLDDAIAAKMKTKDAVIEQALRGLLCIYRITTTEDALDILVKTLPSYDPYITPEVINDFWQRSMLVRYFADVDQECRIVVRQDFDCQGINDRMRRFIPEDARMLLAYGSYPYIKPYNKAQKTFFGLLENRLGKLEAGYMYTRIYFDLQDGSEVMSKLSRELVAMFDGDTDIILPASNAFNNTPRIFLNGFTPAMVFPH